MLEALAEVTSDAVKQVSAFQVLIVVLAAWYIYRSSVKHAAYTVRLALESHVKHESREEYRLIKKTILPKDHD
jgi:hypothetical protein